MARYIRDCFMFIKRHMYLISWISLVIYVFYYSFIYYLNGRQFFYLRQILGIGLCISRGTAAVLNLCCALVLLPLCKKLNQLLYWMLSKICPGLFFLWLEKAKSFHMNVAFTLLVFAVIHSISHFVNLWNFSRNYDEKRSEINMARYKNESPLHLLMSIAGVSGVSMLLIVLSMGLTSARFVRRRIYNAFWYTHQLYVPFMMLLMIHPLSGILKQEILDSTNDNRLQGAYGSNYTAAETSKFVAIKSTTWLWMTVPLVCFFLDLIWRIFSRNLVKIQILRVDHMAGRTISLTLSCPHKKFTCRMGQYVLVQCSEISIIEWHPFTVVELPTPETRQFVIWIKVKGDWTEALEKCLKEKSLNQLSVLIDGPFSSPLESVSKCDVAICVAAGVGITPYVAVLHDMLRNPKSRFPGRIHLIWIVRNEQEITWLAGLAEQTISKLRYSNRPDRLHLEFYVTNSNKPIVNKNNERNISHRVVVNEKGDLSHVLIRNYNANGKYNTKKLRKQIIIKKIKSNSENRCKNENAHKYVNNKNVTQRNDCDNNERLTLLTPSWRRKSDNPRTCNIINSDIITKCMDKEESESFNNIENLPHRYINDVKNVLPHWNEKLEEVPDNNSYTNNIIEDNFGNKENYNSNYKDVSLSYGYKCDNDERQTLLTPHQKRKSEKQTTGCNTEDQSYKSSHVTEYKTCVNKNDNNDFEIIKQNNENIDNKIDDCVDEACSLAKRYPLVGCRLRRGRPHWDRVFGYWAHLYPERNLNLYCCGPKKLVKLLREKCKHISRRTKTKLTFIHEAFS